jgi:ApbE superfamily uncharacterized protein (UPF0280 family)
MKTSERPAHFRDERFYRGGMAAEGLVRFDARVFETDLAIFAEKDLTKVALGRVVELRNDLEGYADAHEDFYGALEPLEAADGAPEIVRRMCAATGNWGVGPMAAVAGTFAEMVGGTLLGYSREVIVENGGDIFMKCLTPREVGIFAGEDSPFAGKLAVRVRPESGIRGICTSSGTIGHSLSRGKADAVVTFAGSAAFADAAATAIGNKVKTSEGVERVVEDERTKGALKGLVIVIGDKMGAFGDIEFV